MHQHFNRTIVKDSSTVLVVKGWGSRIKPRLRFAPYAASRQELSKPRLATPLHACVLVTYLLIYLGTYLFTRLLTRYVLQPLLYKLSKIVLI